MKDVTLRYKDGIIKAYDGNGKDVTDLKPEDFVIKLGGHEDLFLELKYNTEVNGYQVCK